MLGANGIVGAGLPLAVGAGMSIDQADTDQVCLAFFGEGAMAEGMVHEAMNLASVKNLPVVFVCENNQYGEMTPAEEQHHVEGFEARGDAYGIPARTVDGMSVGTVRDATAEAVSRARRGLGPTLLICETYRYRGHYEGDPMDYRSEDELESWRASDPIESLADSLKEQNHLSVEELDQMWDAADDQVSEAVEFARESSYPDEDAAYADVYAEEYR